MTQNAVEDKLRKVRKLRDRVFKTGEQSKSRHRSRASNSYPDPDKPQLQYFTLMNAFYALLMLVVFYLVGQMYFFTAGVYVETFAALAQDQGDTILINLGSQFAEKIPVVGLLFSTVLGFLESIINSFETNSLGLVGLTIYMILQSGELMPTVVYESPDLMFWLIRKFESHQKISISKDDSKALARMKQRHNEYYDSFLNTIEEFRLYCYIADVLICFFLIRFVRVYVDASGTWELQRFLEAAQRLTFGLGDLDPLSTTRMGCSLFLLWVVVKCAMRLTRGFKMFARREKNV